MAASAAKRRLREAKRRARKEVRRAVKAGKLAEPETCEDCFLPDVLPAVLGAQVLEEIGRHRTDTKRIARV